MNTDVSKSLMWIQGFHGSKKCTCSHLSRFPSSSPFSDCLLHKISLREQDFSHDGSCWFHPVSFTSGGSFRPPIQVFNGIHHQTTHDHIAESSNCQVFRVPAMAWRPGTEVGLGRPSCMLREEGRLRRLGVTTYARYFKQKAQGWFDRTAKQVMLLSS